MDLTREKELEVLLDRQAIMDCIHRYTRGVDRLDADLIRSAYHPGAIDDHGIFSGPVEEFVEWVMKFHGERHHIQYHYVTNHNCDLDGDMAHTETYYIFVGHNTAGTPFSIHGGRYIDRFEKRNGRWGIAARINITDWNAGLGSLELPSWPESSRPGVSARDKSDSSYQRPLRTPFEIARDNK